MTMFRPAFARRFMITIAAAAVLIAAGRPASAAPLWGLDTSDERLFTIDTVTGTVTEIGGVLPTFFFGGLSFDAGGNLMALLDNRLYLLDQTTAAATLVGTAAGRTFESFEIINGVGYSVDVFNNNLYAIDLTTGAATAVGASARATGLAQIGGSLYATRVNERDLVQIDTATGAFTVVGVHNIVNSTSLAYAGGLFWTSPAFLGTLYSIDPLTGAATLQHSGFGGTIGHATGLTALPAATPVPEPASLLLLGAGLAGIGARYRRKQS